MKDDKRYAAGMKVRRAVLGDKWVKKATAARTTLDEEWQAHITQFAWGEVWTRPGLKREIRSYMTLALMIALGRWEEFNLHVVAAFNNGLDENDIKEIIFHAACYCGVPAGNNAFAEAKKTLAEIGRAPKLLTELEAPRKKASAKKASAKKVSAKKAPAKTAPAK